MKTEEREVGAGSDKVMTGDFEKYCPVWRKGSERNMYGEEMKSILYFYIVDVTASMFFYVVTGL